MMAKKNEKNGFRSKLDRFPNYDVEYQVNSTIFLNVIQQHLVFIGLPAKNNLDFHGLYLTYRIEDILVSVTDDLMRYASYHNIPKEIGKDSKEVYSICEAVRAAVFTKWILKIRASIADKELLRYSSSVEDDTSILEKREHRLEFCNEYLALVCVAQIFNIKHTNGKILSFNKFLTKEFLVTLLYTLRYRVTHQDSYVELFRYIFKNYSITK